MTKTIQQRLAEAGLPPLPRSVWLEIDEAVLAHNLDVFRRISGVGVYAVVKADAYGHGLLPVARVFERAGADRLCVASFDEAVALRDGGISAAVLVLFPTPPVAAIEEAAQRSIELTLSDRISKDVLDSWHANSARPELMLHVEVETGLTRGGFDPAYVPTVLEGIGDTPGFRVGALWTHMATPTESEFTAQQVAAFDRAAENIRHVGLPVPPRHIAATGALLSGHVPAYEGIRVGLGLYGIVPDDLVVAAQFRSLVDQLRPAMTLKCQALRTETFPAGTRVSYGGRWTAERESIIATLPVGYADALPRNAPPGDVLVRGRRAPIVGSVAMDAVMVDVTDVPGVTVDDEFVLLGRQGDDEISANDLARLRNTIPWEVLTSMSQRVPRVYYAGSVLLGLRSLAGEVRSTPGEAKA